MAKRFTATEIWGEDWFIGMPNSYKLFWYFMLAKCDHAGIYRVNTKVFCSLAGVKINSSEALRLYNFDKIRIRVVTEKVWLVEDFFVYQYGTTFNVLNKVHESIQRIYKQHNIELTSIRGLKDLKEGVKDKDKDNYRKGEKNQKMQKRGIEFDVTGEFVFFEDGSKQKLGQDQKYLLELKQLSPNAVIEGNSY